MAKSQKTKQSARHKELVAAAKELNEVLGIEPEIDVKLGEEELEAKIIEASELITTEDEFTDATEAVLESLSPSDDDEDMAEGDVESGEDFDDEEEEDDFEDDEEEAEAEAEASIEDLINHIKSIKRRADLKDVVESNDIFEALRAKLKSYATGEALKGAMIKVLERLDSSKEEAEEPKAEKPKAEPKAEKPKAAPVKSGKDFKALLAEIETKKNVFMTFWVDNLLLEGGTKESLGATLNTVAKKDKLTSWEGGALRIHKHINARKRQGYLFEEKDGSIKLVGRE